MRAKKFTKTYSYTSKSTWGKREGRHRSLLEFFTWISLQIRNMIRSVRAKTLGQRGHPQRSAARPSLVKDTILSKSGQKKNTTTDSRILNFPRFCQDKSNLLNHVAKRQAFYTLVRTQSNWFKHCHNPAYPTRATALMAGTVDKCTGSGTYCSNLTHAPFAQLIATQPYFIAKTRRCTKDV